MPSRTRWLIRLAALVAVLGAIAALGPLWRLAWPEVATRLRSLELLAAADPAAALALYVLAYAGLAALCVPVGPVMSMAGGALFGPYAGTCLAIVGATSGSIVMFLAARGTIGRAIARRRSAMILRLRPRLERDGLWAVLALRLAPVVPSWLVNLAAAFAGMRVRPFAIGTAIGLVPATAVLATAGAGLGEALASGAPPDLAAILRPAVLLPLLALAALALLPALLRTTP